MVDDDDDATAWRHADDALAVVVKEGRGAKLLADTAHSITDNNDVSKCRDPNNILGYVCVCDGDI
jgi:hypothetical protein